VEDIDSSVVEVCSSVVEDAGAVEVCLSVVEDGALVDVGAYVVFGALVDVGACVVFGALVDVGACVVFGVAVVLPSRSSHDNFLISQSALVEMMGTFETVTLPLCGFVSDFPSHCLVSFTWKITSASMVPTVTVDTSLIALPGGTSAVSQ
jgi:hypothetical protein